MVGLATRAEYVDYDYILSRSELLYIYVCMITYYYNNKIYLYIPYMIRSMYKWISSFSCPAVRGRRQKFQQKKFFFFFGTTYRMIWHIRYIPLCQKIYRKAFFFPFFSFFSFFFLSAPLPPFYFSCPRQNDVCMYVLYIFKTNNYT